ncbi:hypothetical protein DAPPUDRAFT_302919 [Daphnia pulex]|uniref:Uncharacterized protein n=1 Tax=Daphnia pulex TaxID=6669 RepID=E9HQ18_DAPPU|nr:hypothetical protein DAPPUDRAFT_302919 [Daphnia pulex]|eukprot:EFX66167.1 hypothetical protein DAPPUDRAFT_302919 [Daphnia pulex]
MSHEIITTSFILHVFSWQRKKPPTGERTSFTFLAHHIEQQTTKRKEKGNMKDRKISKRQVCVCVCFFKIFLVSCTHGSS